MSTMTLPNTPETAMLQARYERLKRLKHEALRRMAADFNLMPCPISQVNAGTVLFEDALGNYYDTEAIALAVLNHYLRSTDLAPA